MWPQGRVFPRKRSHTKKASPAPRHDAGPMRSVAVGAETAPRLCPLGGLGSDCGDESDRTLKRGDNGGPARTRVVSGGRAALVLVTDFGLQSPKLIALLDQGSDSLPELPTDRRAVAPHQRCQIGAHQARCPRVARAQEIFAVVHPLNCGTEFLQVGSPICRIRFEEAIKPVKSIEKGVPEHGKAAGNGGALLRSEVADLCDCVAYL